MDSQGKPISRPSAREYDRLGRDDVGVEKTRPTRWQKTRHDWPGEEFLEQRSLFDQVGVLRQILEKYPPPPSESPNVRALARGYM
jgi:hypothetical protein